MIRIIYIKSYYLWPWEEKKDGGEGPVQNSHVSWAISLLLQIILTNRFQKLKNNSDKCIWELLQNHLIPQPCSESHTVSARSRQKYSIKETGNLILSHFISVIAKHSPSLRHQNLTQLHFSYLTPLIYSKGFKGTNRNEKNRARIHHFFHLFQNNPF